MNKSPFAKAIHSLALISCTLCVLFALVNHFFPRILFLALAITWGTIGYHFVMRLFVGWLVPLIVRERLNPEGSWFQSRSFEKKLYQRLRVRRWKGKMPTYDPREFSFTDNSPERIIRNSCSAELVHEVIALLSFAPMLVIPVFGEAAVFIITSILAALTDCVFVIMQRYNRPRLQQYLKRQGVSSTKN